MYYTEYIRGTGEYRRLVAAPILIALTAIAWIIVVWIARAGGGLMTAGVDGLAALASSAASAG
ncbi:MAG TPA: hypothetical protein VGA58_08960 [bacterium]